MSLTKVLTKCKLKTNYFNNPQCKVAEFRPDQCVIIKEKYLTDVEGFDFVKPPKDQPAPLQWYPMVNSYYNHAEDVCAYERVSKLLTTKPSLMSIKTENDSPYETDPYSEKDAQLQYLLSKPACFVILGKPGVGQEELAKKLADYWRCVYIDPETLIKEEIASGTRAGECIEFNLRCGRAIGIDIILRLIEKRIKSKSAQHRGFVIAGIPVVPNELYEEDPVSSESAVFNVQEIFEEIYDTVLEVGVPVTKHVSIISESKQGESVDEEEADEEKFPEAEEAEEVPPELEPEPTELAEKVMIDVGSAHENICQMPFISTNCEEQLQFLFSLLEEPLIIIYMRCGNEDVMSKRNNYRYHLYTDRSIDLLEIEAYKLIHSLYSKEPGATNYEVPMDLFEIMPHEDVSKLQHLVRLPRHFPANVATQLNAYYLHALTTIEQHILSHDPQYFLKLDGRATIEKMFNILKTRLEILPLQKVVLPEKLNLLEVPKQGEEFDAFVADFQGLSFEECFQKLRRKLAPNNMFKWNWSDWGKKCPVSMKEGSYRDGDINLAVHFMNRMYFLSDEDAFWKFYRNPRPYLLPPYPKPSCRIFIFGPSASGKTTIAKCLGYMLNSTVLNVDEMKESYVLQKEKEHREKIKQAALIEGINLLNENRELKRQFREDLLKTWFELIASQKLALTKRTTWKLEEEITFDVELTLDIPNSPNREYFSDLMVGETSTVLKFRFSDDLMNCLGDPKSLDMYLPSSINYESGIDETASVLDDFVISYAEAAVDDATYDAVEFTDEDLADMFSSQIKEVEDKYFEQGNNRGGWIVDGMLINFNLLDMLSPDYLADDIIILRDQDNFLLKNYSFDGRTVFRNFRQFFFDIGNVDAAWRSPDSESTPSFKKGMIRDIIYDAILNKYNFEDGTEPGEIDETFIEPTWTKSVEVHANNLRSYAESLDELVEYFTSRQLTPIDLNVVEKSITDLLKEAVKCIQDRYGQSVIPLTDEDRYEEYQDFGSPNVQAEGMFEGAAEPATEDLFAKNRRFGDSLWYCPVCLYDKWVLFKGKEDFAAMYGSKIYLFESEDHMSSFISDPRKYIFANEPPCKVPPPRICVVGIKSSGKTTIAKALAKNIGVAYIEGSTLHEDALGAFVEQLWFSEPMKSVGFVLDEFPRSLADMTFILEHKAIPDLVINIVVEENEIKNRLLNKAIEEWKIKSQEERLIREALNKEMYIEWEQNRAAKIHELMEEKRQERYSRQIENKRSEDPVAGIRGEMTDGTATPRSVGAFSQVTYDSFAEQEDKKEIEKMLDKAIPEPVFDDAEVDEEEIVARLEEELDEMLGNNFNYLAEIRELCDQELIPWTDLDGSRNEKSTIYQAFISTYELKNRNKSMFERCYDISLDIAEQLLSCGYHFLSKFGKTCPVQYFKNINPIQMYIPMKEKNHLYPVIHRQFIYFLAGEDNWIEFKNNPLKYTRISKLDFPLLPFRISIIGPQKCGKSSLALRIQNEYSARTTTCGQAIRYALRYLPHCKLAREMEQKLRLGESTTYQMQMESGEVVYFDPYSLTQGIVFDGFPNNQQEAGFLRDLGLMPHLILYLEANDDQVYERLSSMTGTRNLPVYSEKFFNIRYDYWKENSPIFATWMDREYQNISRIPTDLSLWHIWNHAQKLIAAVFSEIKHYFIHAHDDWPLRIANMLVTPLEYLERISDFKSYCPGCLYYTKSLKHGGDIPDRTNLVHFAEHFYWLCDNHIEEFLEFPEKFLPPFNKNLLPKVIPDIVILDEQPDECYEEGVCMVCYSQNKQRKVFTMGVLYFAVNYGNTVYLFDTKECMEEFLSTPHEYASLVIPYKDPTNMASLKYNELPILGYLEQYVAKDIIRAVNEVARVRPVVPGLSIEVSAAIRMALYLKLHCVHTRYSEMYRKAESTYNLRCEHLLEYLEKMKRFLDPSIYYEEPMPKLKKYTPNRNLRDYMHKLLFNMLDKVNYDKFYHGV